MDALDFAHIVANVIQPGVDVELGKGAIERYIDSRVKAVIGDWSIFEQTEAQYMRGILMSAVEWYERMFQHESHRPQWVGQAKKHLSAALAAAGTTSGPSQ